MKDTVGKMAQDRYQNAWKWVIVAAIIFYALLLPRYDIGFYNDDAVYVLAGKSLLQGKYLSLASPNQPLAAFPMPGMPLVLAPLIWLIQPHWFLLEWASLLVTAFTGLLFVRLFRSWLSPRMLVVSLALYLFNPITAHFSGMLMSMPYYLMFVFLAFILFEEVVEKDSRGAAWAMGLCMGWASLVRPEGCVLLPAIGIGLAYERRWKDLIRAEAPALLILGLYLARNWYSVHGLMNEYHSDIAASLPYWSGRYAILFRHFINVSKECVGRSLLAWPYLPELNALYIVGSLIGLALLAIGVVRYTMESEVHPGLLLAVVAFCYFYFLSHGMWFVFDLRYVLPLLPFMYVFILTGARHFSRWMKPPRLLTAMAGLLVMVCYGYQNAYGLYESIFPPSQNLTPQTTFRWILRNTEAQNVFLTPMAPVLYLYDRRPSLSLITGRDEEEFFYRLSQDKIEWVLDRPFNALTSPIAGYPDPTREWARIRRWINLHPEWFALDYRNKREETSVFRVSMPPAYAAAYELYLSGLEAFEAGQWPKGLQKLDAAIQMYPNLAAAHNAYGATHLLMKDNLERARSELLKAIALRPNYPIALLNLARLYHLMGRREMAQSFLQKSIDASRATGEEDAFFALIEHALVPSDSNRKSDDTQSMVVALKANELSPSVIDGLFEQLDKTREGLLLQNAVAAHQTAKIEEDRPSPWEAGYARPHETPSEPIPRAEY